MSAQQAEPQFSRPVHVDGVGADKVTFELEAHTEERRALGRRLGLRSLDRLTATARVKRAGAAGVVHLRVNFVADVVQSCVVTLDPVPVHIEESFELVYAPEEDIPVERGEVVLTQDGEEPPEPLRDGILDLGEAVAEHLALALDPYPRKPGVSVGDVLAEVAGDGEGEDGSPFAVLRELKERT